MNRSEFIKSFLAKGVLLTSPFLVKAKEKKLTEIILVQDFVAGFQYADGLKLLDKMKKGDELHLVREPENIHDENAVAVYWNQNRIGYVPAFENELPNTFLASGLSLRARIDELNQKAKPWLACKFGIYLLYPTEMIRKNLSLRRRK